MRFEGSTPSALFQKWLEARSTKVESEAQSRSWSLEFH